MKITRWTDGLHVSTTGPEPMPFERYRAIDAVNASLLKDLGVSGLYARHRLDHPGDDDSDTLRLGRAAHCAALEPDRYASEFVCYPDRRAGKAWDAFAAEHAAQTILTAAQHRTAWAIGQAVMRHGVARDLLRHGVAEHVITWEDTSGDCPTRCKARMDWFRPGMLVDLKTAARPHPGPFAAAAARLGYHLQLALYADGIETVTGERPDVRIIAAESAPPYDVGVYAVSDEILDAGRRLYRERLVMLDGYRSTGVWPGFAPHELDLVLPPWAGGMDDGPSLTFDGEEF